MGHKGNALAREKSPYLLQHQFNPVGWYPWGEEAFARARRENKPIFLSIGYSTCHWCHVMERESFENDRIAAFLNQHFISIKVDREERPDVDGIYMTFVQATTGQGGWPLNVFLTPDLKPFFGGTYFPPDDRHGRPGFLHLLSELEQVWQTKRGDITDSARDMHSRLTAALAESARGSSGAQSAGEQAIQHAGQVFKRQYDPRHGGFGGAPKFPQPSQPQFLLRYAQRFHDREAVQMVLHTCDRMAAGGIHDQLGGGFSRYSVDTEWLVPHFEKMLYDNAQLAALYLDAYLLSGESRFAEVARDTFEYVLRDMTHPDGGFYSAEDADSEGHEGKFYCWTTNELAALLTADECRVARRYFGLTDHGNFLDHSHPEPLPNQNVLSVVDPALSSEEQALLTSAKLKMAEARNGRIRPHLDDKVLASWNGLMLGALARGAVVLGDQKYLEATLKNAQFLKEHLWDAATGTLFHRWREGERDQVQLLEAYAFLLCGLIDLYEATLNPEHLSWAIDIAESMTRRFYDPENGGFWQTVENAPDLIFRVKREYDGAEPSGNSVASMALLRLSAITGNGDFAKAAEKTIQLFSDRLSQTPQAVPFMLQALDFSLQEPRRVVISGSPRMAEAQALLRAVHSVYQPNKIVLGTEGQVEPFAGSLPGGTPAVYVCTGTQCQQPTADREKIKHLLAEP